MVVLVCLGLCCERNKFISHDTGRHPAIKREERKKKRLDPTSVADASLHFSCGWCLQSHAGAIRLIGAVALKSGEAVPHLLLLGRGQWTQLHFQAPRRYLQALPASPLLRNTAFDI